MSTISTTLYAGALRRDLVRYRDTVGYVDRDRIKERMIDTVDDLLGPEADSIDIVETIMMLPDGLSDDDLESEIAKIICPEAASI